MFIFKKNHKYITARAGDYILRNGAILSHTTRFCCQMILFISYDYNSLQTAAAPRLVILSKCVEGIYVSLIYVNSRTH